MMRKQLIFLVTLLALFFLTLAGPSTQKVRATDDGFPCDPIPKEIFLCQRNGGTFNYATCRCEFN